MASTMASTFALSRPSEKFGTHSTRVDITGKDIGVNDEAASMGALHFRSHHTRNHHAVRRAGSGLVQYPESRPHQRRTLFESRRLAISLQHRHVVRPDDVL